MTEIVAVVVIVVAPVAVALHLNGNATVGVIGTRKTRGVAERESPTGQ